MTPITAWEHLKSLDTLDLRVRAQANGAVEIAKALEGHAKLGEVRYPTLPSHPQYDVASEQAESGGTVIAFEVKGGKEPCFNFLNALEIVTISNNFADSKSIVTHPASTTHQRLPQEHKDVLGSSDGLVRLSIGLEDTGDLIADLMQALDKI
jgi:O-succinylhomoserine sulfhydrylase